MPLRHGMNLRGSLLLGLAALAAAPVCDAVDFDTCVQDALKQAPAAMVARAQAAEAKGMRNAAQGHLLPKLSASFGGAQSNNALTVFGMKLSQRVATFNDFGAGQFTGPDALGVAPNNLDHPGAYHNLSSQLQLDIPIWNGGEIRGGIDEAQAMLRAAQQGDRFAAQKLTLTLLQAYDGVVAAQAGVEVAEKAHTAADAYVKTTRQLLEQGVVVKSDLLSAQVHQETAALDLERARGDLANAKLNLELLTGWKGTAPISVDASVLPPLPAGDLSTLLTQAMADNPGLLALREKVHAAREGVDVARAAYLPHVNAMAKQEWNGTNFGNSVPSYTVGGQITWTALDFSRGGESDAAQAKVQLALAKLQEAEDQTRLQVARSWRAAREAALEVKTRGLAVRQTEEAQRLVRLRYDNGIETLTGLLHGQTELDQARAELLRARYAEAVQRGSLLLALGKMTTKDWASLAAAPMENAQ